MPEFSTATQRLSDRLEAVSEPAGERHQLTGIERKQIGETIRTGKTITQDDRSSSKLA
jgi:hypothetical protein